jgi:polyhydroxyalkanoate synthesis regulator phasin
MVAASQEALAQLQRRVDERVRSGIESVQGLADLKRDVAQLQARIEELEKRLSDLGR